MQIRTVILKIVEIKHSSVDVTPTLGVNHVISGVVVLVLFSISVCFSHINNCINLISKITVNR